MRQLVVVEEPYGVRELIANMAHLVQRVRLVIVVLLRNINNGHVTRSKRIKSTTHQKIKDGQTQHFECDAHVAVVVEPVQHFDAQTVKVMKYR